MRRALVLAALLAACKADLHHTTDANAPGVPGDTLAPSIGDPPPGAVTLTVTRLGQPMPDVAVFFQNADSSLVGASLTNAKGLAWAAMTPGGFVTAVEHKGSGVDELSTFAAVEPGDALALDVEPVGPRDQVTFALTFPDAAAASYAIYTPCGSMHAAATTVAFTGTGCANLVDFVIVPLDGQGTPAGPALSAPSTAIDAPAVALTGAYQPFAATTFAYTSVPASWQFIGLYHAISAERRAYEQSGGTAPSSTVAALQLALPWTAASTLTVTTQFPTTSELGRQQIYNWQPASTVYVLDLGSVQLAPYASAPAYDRTARVVSWTEGTGAQGDVVRARLHLYRDDIPAGRTWTWRIAAPRTATSVAYPQLPVLDFDFNAQPSDTLSIDELTTIQVPGGYAGFRAHAYGDPMLGVTGASGRMVIQTAFSREL
ncbi:MAG: hypothetical protein HOV81_32575 [Kofleriaceae bacterium]|nr:hypothetical protein [Kofleriaceae bacterium]